MFYLLRSPDRGQMRGGDRGRGLDRIGGGGGPILASPPSPSHIKEMQLEQQRVLLRQQQQFQSRFPGMSRQKSMIDLREPYLEQQQYHHAYHPHPPSQHYPHFPQQQQPQAKHKPGPLLRSRTEHDLKRSRSRGSGLDMIHRQTPQPADHVPTVLRRQMVRILRKTFHNPSSGTLLTLRTADAILHSYMYSRNSFPWRATAVVH